MLCTHSFYCLLWSDYTLMINELISMDDQLLWKLVFLYLEHNHKLKTSIDKCITSSFIQLNIG